MSPQQGGFFVAIRRPLVITAALGCLASLGSTGIVTARLAGPAVVYWTYAPLTELLAVGLVLMVTRRGPQRLSAAVDAHFAGCAAVILLLLLIGVMLGSTRPDLAWALLTTAGVAMVLAGLAWSARIDYCYFRDFLRQTPRGALVRVLLLRIFVWPIVFGVFAVPGLTFRAMGDEFAGIVRELLG